MTVEQSILYEGETKPKTNIVRSGETQTETLGLSDDIDGNDIDALYYLDVVTECDQFGEGLIYFDNPFTGLRQPKFVHPNIQKHIYEIISPNGKKGTVTWTYILEKGVSYGLRLAPELKGRLEK